MYNKEYHSHSIMQQLKQEAPLTLKGQCGRCTNIKEGSQIFGHAHFSSGCDFMMGLGKPKLCTNLKSLASAVAEILKRKAQISGAPLAQGHTHFFFWWDLMMGLGKPQEHAKFEVAGFIYYGNIREFVFKRQIRFLILRHALGKLGVTYGLHL